MTNATCSWHWPATRRGNFSPEACSPKPGSQQRIRYRAHAEQECCPTHRRDAPLHVPGFLSSPEVNVERGAKLKFTLNLILQGARLS